MNSKIPTRPLGKTRLALSSIGLGCMGMSEFYGETDDAESVRVIHEYLNRGGNFFDTADMYGVGKNEALIGRAMREGGYATGAKRGQVILATKFGNVRGPNGEFAGVNGTPAYVKSACDASLKRLQLDQIDLYYQHRVDPNVPIEDTVGAMAELVSAGKVRFLGLSEAGAKTIRRANAVHPIAALQTEYSLWYREPEQELIPLCEELGITFVAYSPLGRGLLTGQYKSFDELPADDYRRQSPRFQRENFQKNLDLVKQVEAMADEKGVSANQIALAWILQTQPNVVPIPGTKRMNYLVSNVESATLELTTEEIDRLNAVFPFGAGSGLRYVEAMMSRVGI